MRILLLGKKGQVGWELARNLMPLGELVALDRTQCDLSCPESVAGIVQLHRPDVIVNAAAYTAVDKAEEEEELATTVNATSVGIIAEEARKLKALFIHYSTDYVFDGEKRGAYLENDVPNPLNAYGRSKLLGENAIVQSGCDYLILRTTWVYAARGKNFLKTIFRLAQERDELSIVADQHGAPTWAKNIADVTAYLIVKAQNEKHKEMFLSGLYHLSASGVTTWHGFSNAIIKHAKDMLPENRMKTQKVRPISTEEYPLPAKRPLNSQLDVNALESRFGLVMPEWYESMKLCLDEVLETK